MIERYPQVRFYWDVEGERFPCVRTSLSICFYMQRPHREVIPAVINALEIYREAIGPSTLAWYPDREGYWQELDEAGWKLTRQEMIHPRGANIVVLDTPQLTADYEFRYSGRDVEAASGVEGSGRTCAVAFWLPTEYLDSQGPARVRKLALELGSGLPFNSGHAGLSFYFAESMQRVSAALREPCFRHPGMDMPAMEKLPAHLGTRIKGAYWLTFLGPPVLESIGGAAGLGSRLHSPGTDVEALSAGRAVVTLGEWPEAGDLEHGHDLPAYRELAQVLEPWLHRAPRSPWSGFSDEDVRRWERRFLDPSMRQRQ
ncbi:MAG: DUF3396 domain-containing protein [Myxococcaceae bacterium]|nr:DUF3396 domain-containing protein [Myxococcaceae bacterium]